MTEVFCSIVLKSLSKFHYLSKNTFLDGCPADRYFEKKAIFFFLKTTCPVYGLFRPLIMLIVVVFRTIFGNESDFWSY
jgi:hypothetical protein